jgi:BirA family biotin operon repressor/biotin-[acetyl-CoA-carboxylase] ligase
VIFTQLILANLKTKYIGKTIEYYTKTESTNNDAWELCDENGKDGTAIIAGLQSKGRGRQGKKWHSAPGKGLAFSVLIYPDISTENSGLFSIAVAIAIHKALLQYEIESQLKWPNDILIEGKKLGGILCESRISKNKVKALVIGIGLNVNESRDDFPPEISAQSTSLFLRKGIPFQRERILASILNELEIVIEALKENQIASVMHDWESACGHLNKTISIQENDEVKTGIFSGINAQGNARLIIDGKIKTISSGELL